MIPIYTIDEKKKKNARMILFNDRFDRFTHREYSRVIFKEERIAYNPRTPVRGYFFP